MTVEIVLETGFTLHPGSLIDRGVTGAHFPAVHGISSLMPVDRNNRGQPMMRTTSIQLTTAVESPPAASRPDLPWRDSVLVVAVTLVTVVAAAHFELNESIYALTRHREYLQLDEWPAGVIVLLGGMMWWSWKRHRHARRELQARRIAEAALAEVLAENRRLARENLRIQEMQNKHLARELHDELGQYLNAIKLDATSVQETAGRDPAFDVAAARSIIGAVDHVHRAVSGMIGRLRPAGLDELGLVAAMEHCVDHWRQRLPHTRFTLSVAGDCEDLGEAVNLTLFRLTQEGLTNVFKHAGARQVDIRLEGIEGPAGRRSAVRLTLADDGCGMAPAAPTARFGLSGMRERVELAGGTLLLASAPGNGLRVEAELPAPPVPQRP
jgi:signal transduction histidine kinase